MLLNMGGIYYMRREQVVAGLIDGEDICRLRESVCVQVEKVYDHCREKDCVEDAVVDFIEDVKNLIDRIDKGKELLMQSCKSIY